MSMAHSTIKTAENNRAKHLQEMTAAMEPGKGFVDQLKGSEDRFFSRPQKLANALSDALSDEMDEKPMLAAYSLVDAIEKNASRNKKVISVVLDSLKEGEKYEHLIDFAILFTEKHRERYYPNNLDGVGTFVYDATKKLIESEIPTAISYSGLSECNMDKLADYAGTVDPAFDVTDCSWKGLGRLAISVEGKLSKADIVDLIGEFTNKRSIYNYYGYSRVERLFEAYPEYWPQIYKSLPEDFKNEFIKAGIDYKWSGLANEHVAHAITDAAKERIQKFKFDSRDKGSWEYLVDKLVFSTNAETVISFIKDSSPKAKAYLMNAAIEEEMVETYDAIRGELNAAPKLLNLDEFDSREIGKQEFKKPETVLLLFPLAVKNNNGTLANNLVSFSEGVVEKILSNKDAKYKLSEDMRQLMKQIRKQQKQRLNSMGTYGADEADLGPLEFARSAIESFNQIFEEREEEDRL